MDQPKLKRYLQTTYVLADETATEAELIIEHQSVGNYLFHESDAGILKIFSNPSFFTNKETNTTAIWSEIVDSDESPLPDFLAVTVPAEVEASDSAELTTDLSNFPEGTYFRVSIEGYPLATTETASGLKYGVIPQFLRGRDRVIYIIASKEGHYPKVWEGTVTVNGINIAPTVFNYTTNFVVQADAEFIGKFNIRDIDNDYLDINVVYTQPTMGTVVVNMSNKTFTLTTNELTGGSDSFSMTFDDGLGGKSTVIVDFEIKATPVQDNSVVTIGAYSSGSVDLYPTDLDSDLLELSMKVLSSPLPLTSNVLPPNLEPNTDIGEEYLNGFRLEVEHNGTDVTPKVIAMEVSDEFGLSTQFTVTVYVVVPEVFLVIPEDPVTILNPANEYDLSTLTEKSIDIEVPTDPIVVSYEIPTVMLTSLGLNTGLRLSVNKLTHKLSIILPVSYYSKTLKPLSGDASYPLISGYNGIVPSLNTSLYNDNYVFSDPELVRNSLRSIARNTISALSPIGSIKLDSVTLHCAFRFYDPTREADTLFHTANLHYSAPSSIETVIEYKDGSNETIVTTITGASMADWTNTGGQNYSLDIGAAAHSEVIDVRVRVIDHHTGRNNSWYDSLSVVPMGAYNNDEITVPYNSTLTTKVDTILESREFKFKLFSE